MADFSKLAQPGSPEELLIRRIDRTRVPRHVAIIMDGTGRWAKSRNLPRVEGHRAGVAAVRDTVESSAQLGLDVLTLYAFSVENWKRPRFEVWTLMNLLKEYVRKERQNLVDNDIRFHAIGRWQELAPSVVRGFEPPLKPTWHFWCISFNIALNYSGRFQIAAPCRRIVADWA